MLALTQHGLVVLTPQRAFSIRTIRISRARVQREAADAALRTVVALYTGKSALLGGAVAAGAVVIVGEKLKHHITFKESLGLLESFLPFK